MGIFRIKKENIKSPGGHSPKWRVFLCDNKGEPMDEHYTSFLADRIISSDSEIPLTEHDDVSFSCDEIRVDENNQVTTVIF